MMLIEVRRFHQCAALLFMGLSCYILFEARSFEYYTRVGPGPGFFPFWIGAITLLLSGVWLLQLTRNKTPQLRNAVAIDLKAAGDVLFVLGALIAFAIAVNTLGFVISMFAFLFVLLRYEGQQSWFVTLAVCVGGSAGVFYLFRWLDVSLPTAGFSGFAWLPF